jgi:ribonuclease Z
MLRALPSVAILRGDELILFDAGEGVQSRIAQARLGLNRPMKIFIGHMHGDHVVGLLGLLQTMAMVDRTRPVEIFGPHSLKKFLECSMECLGFGLTYDAHLHQLRRGTVFENPAYTITAELADHTNESYAFRLQEKPRPGVFKPEEAKRLRIPEGPLWGKLQSGESVRIQNRIIRPSQVMGEERRGRSFGYSGDTRSSRRLEKFFSGCDVLVFDSTYGDAHKKNARLNRHSTAAEAAELATRANVGLLVLTHFSARYDDVSNLLREAAKKHENVVAASDFMRFDIPYHN